MIETPAGEVTVVEPLGTWGATPPGAEVRLQFLEAGLYLLPGGDVER